MGNALTAIHHANCPIFMGKGSDFLHRENRPQNIGDVRNGNNFCPLGDIRFKDLHIKTAIRIDRGCDGAGPHPLAQQMPGHDIGVMLGNRDQHFIACFQICIAIAMGDQIKAHGRAGSKDHLFFICGMDEFCHLAPYRLIGIGRGFREIMQTAMNIGIGLAIGRMQRIQHHLRLLGRGSGIQINQLFAMNFCFQNRKLIAYRLCIKFRCHPALLSRLASD